MTDYTQFYVMEYQYWILQVHENQGYLGRCIVWCKRDNAFDMTDATLAEREELFTILAAYRKAVQKVFRADWLNYAFLGNEVQHLHGHLIPRYASSREFAGTMFTDVRWGHNHPTDRSFVTLPHVLEEVRRALQNVIV